MEPSNIIISINALICLFVPAIIAITIIIKRKGSWIMFVLGIASFTVSQLLLRMPLINELFKTAWFNEFADTNFMLFIILMAFSAGVFEETGRFAAMRFLNKSLLTWENGILFGLGHGGVEAFSVGLKCAGYIVGIISGKSVLELSDLPPVYYDIGGIIRILAIVTHIGFTLLVLYVVKNNKIRYFLLAVFLHTVADILFYIFPNTGELMSVFFSGGVFVLFAFASIIFSVRIRPALNRAV